MQTTIFHSFPLFLGCEVYATAALQADSYQINRMMGGHRGREQMCISSSKVVDIICWFHLIVLPVYLGCTKLESAVHVSVLDDVQDIELCHLVP